MSISMRSSNHPHAMISEIYEQPHALEETLGRYVRDGYFRSDTCNDLRAWICETQTILIAASGSSRHAGLAAELLIEKLSGVAVDVEYASEYAYRPTGEPSGTSVVVISQSGETSDTLAALRKANRRGNRTLAITNETYSSISCEASISFPTIAGKELAVPATKSFTTQLLNTYLIALLVGESKGLLDRREIEQRLKGLSEIPSLIMRQIDRWYDEAQGIAKRFGSTRNMLLLGRGPHYAIAREGALKLKESAYVHAEAFPCGELKHGPNAVVEADTAVILLATFDGNDLDSLRRYEKVCHLAQDLKSQAANVIVVANSGDCAFQDITPHIMFVDEVDEALSLLCEVIPLQLLSYFMSISRGINVDRPRNLAKAVLVD